MLTFGEQEVDYVNNQLSTLYGRELDGRPKFRIVWSEDQMEIRVGTQNTYSGGILIRTETGARWLRKYNYVRDKFILENLQYYRNKEVLGSENGIYEPIWVFRDAKGEALDPILPACRIIIDSNFYRKPEKKTVKDVERENEAERQKDFQHNLNVIQNNSPYLATMIHNKEAVFHDSTKEKKDEVHSGESSSLPTEGS